MTRTLTLQTLFDKRACVAQVELFRWKRLSQRLDEFSSGVLVIQVEARVRVRGSRDKDCVRCAT